MICERLCGKLVEPSGLGIVLELKIPSLCVELGPNITHGRLLLLDCRKVPLPVLAGRAPCCLTFE